MAKKASVPGHLQLWIEARRKLRLSHAHVQMAFELGLNPKKLGKLDHHHQEPWKLPLQDFIAKLYRKRCGKDRPDTKHRRNGRGEARKGAGKEDQQGHARAGRSNLVHRSARARARATQPQQLMAGRAKIHRGAMSSVASGG